MRIAVVWLLGLVLAFSGCDCGKKSDEEILKERIDTTKVHLYLATKIAIIKADQSPEAKAARDALMAALDAWRGTPREDGKGFEMTAADALALVKALLALRQEGKELLESGDEKGLKPILPLLFSPHPELAEVLDMNMEHALLLTGMFVLKFHPRSPLPIPPEIMLYEAWMTDSSKLMPGLSGLLQAEKAIIYGTNELCDLAALEGAAAEIEADNAELLASALKTVSGNDAIDPKKARMINSGVRAIAHAVTAQCYQQRDEGEKAIDELDKALDAAEELGTPKGELALVRAYIALSRDDHAGAKEQLTIARDDANTTPDDKQDIEAILANLEDDPNIFEKKLGKAFFVIYMAKIILRTLDRQGAFDELKDTELVKTIDGFLSSVAGALEQAKEAIPGKGLVDDAKDLVSSDDD